MNESEAKRMSQARGRLLAIAPFFGAPSLRLQMRENLNVPTLRTDGTHIDYNPEYTSQHSVSQLTFDVAHETAHCLLLHPYRIGGRELRLCNEAGDYAINEMLQSAGFDMPEGLLRDTRFDGQSMEQIYAVLYAERGEPKERGDEPGTEGGQPGGDQPGDDGQNGDEPGEPEAQSQDGNGNDAPDFVPAPAPSEAPGEDDEAEALSGQESASDKPLTADDWKTIAEQAVMLNRKAGTLPGGADRSVTDSRQPVVDWKEALREFIENVIPSGQSWTHPNRRFIAQGVYLPGVLKENTPAIAVAIDTSGSIGEDLLARFAAELNGIVAEVRPERIDVVYCDAEVQRHDTFDADDEVKFEAVGGGGTYFNPVLVDWLDAQDEPPACLIYATDLECADIPVEPSIPVLWLVPENAWGVGPFGTTVKVPVGVR